MSRGFLEQNFAGSRNKSKEKGSKRKKKGTKLKKIGTLLKKTGTQLTKLQAQGAGQLWPPLIYEHSINRHEDTNIQGTGRPGGVAK